MASSELVILLPLLVALVFAVIEFSLLEVGRQRVMNGARQGARVASQPGATFQDVDQAVAFGIGAAPLANTRRVEYVAGANTGDPVVVRVSVMMKAAAPDLLGIIGYGLGSRMLVGSCVTRRE